MGEPRMEEVGRLSAYFARPSVAVVELTGSLRVGDAIYIKGHTTDFQQAVTSMQITHQTIQEAGAGQTVGLKVHDRCRRHDLVFKLTA